MSIDLGQLLDTAAPLAVAAIESSGTSIDFTRPTSDEEVTVDPVTLAVTSPATSVESGAAAIVIAGPAPQQPYGPNLTLAEGQYRVLLLPDVDTIRQGDLGTVVDSRDPMLAGRTLRVSAVLADGAGVVRVLTMEDLPS